MVLSNVTTVALLSMPPYVLLDLVDGLPVATGCLGDIWTLLADLLNLNSRYTIVEKETVAEAQIILLGATNPLSEAFQLAFVSSWYDIHLEESLASIASLSYTANWSPEHWIATTAAAVLYPLVLFFMLRCAEKYYPVTPIDLPPIIPTVSGKKPTLLKPRWRHALMTHRKLYVRNEESFGNCVMASVAGISNQGCCVHSPAIAIRILLVSFLFFGMIMTSAYSALLVSQLTTGLNPERGIEVDEGTTLCVRGDSLPYQMQPVTRKKVIVAESCAQVLCSGYAVLETPELIGVGNIPCKVITLQQRQFQFKLAIGVMPSAPRSLLEDLQIKLREIGLTTRIQRKWLRRPEMHSTPGAIQEITFEQIRGLVSGYIGYIWCSILILIFEIIIYRRLDCT